MERSRFVNSFVIFQNCQCILFLQVPAGDGTTLRAIDRNVPIPTIQWHSTLFLWFCKLFFHILKTVFYWFRMRYQVVLIQKYPTKMRRNHIVRNWQEWSNPNNCWQRHSMAFNPPHKCWQPHWISKLTKACKGLHIVWQWKYENTNQIGLPEWKGKEEHNLVAIKTFFHANENKDFPRMGWGVSFDSHTGWFF